MSSYLGIPRMGDEVYGGSRNMAVSQLQLKSPSDMHSQLSQLVTNLHALTLGGMLYGRIGKIGK
ncbi:hypothetical protein R6Q59_005286 [Mikania micrantha]